jgi:hypothetical protein
MQHTQMCSFFDEFTFVCYSQINSRLKNCKIFGFSLVVVVQFYYCSTTTSWSRLQPHCTESVWTRERERLRLREKSGIRYLLLSSDIAFGERKRHVNFIPNGDIVSLLIQNPIIKISKSDLNLYIPTNTGFWLMFDTFVRDKTWNDSLNKKMKKFFD